MDFKKIVSFIILSYAPHSQLIGQSAEGGIWYFGNQLGFEFNGNFLPTVVDDGQMQSFEGCVTQTDENGDLLFYSNGGSRPGDSIIGGIWNKNHELIYEFGENEGGGYSAGQSSAVIPHPGEDSKYILFTMDEFECELFPEQLCQGLSMFEIDMSLNDSLGGISDISLNIYQNSIERLTAVEHTNEEDYWIIISDKTTQEFVVFLVSNEGISEPSFYPSDPNNAPSGRILVSPDKSKLITGRALYDFNPLTGEILQSAGFNVQAFRSVAFSPNSDYLFAFEQLSALEFQLNRYTLSNPVPEITAIIIGQSPNGIQPGHMQLAIDGNIYVSAIDFDNDLTQMMAIRCTNSDSPQLETEIMVFPDDLFGGTLGLPNFSDHIFKNDEEFILSVDLGPDTIFAASGEEVLLEAPLGFEYLWSDGSIGSTLAVTEGGLYSVTISDFCSSASDEIYVVFEESLSTVDTYEKGYFECKLYPSIVSRRDFVVTPSLTCGLEISSYSIIELSTGRIVFDSNEADSKIFHPGFSSAGIYLVIVHNVLNGIHDQMSTHKLIITE